MLLDLAYRLRRAFLKLTGWRTRGAKVMVFDGSGRLLLVRNGYGARDRWVLPGGGVRRREAPEAAARREVMEETGCRLDALEPVAVYAARAEGRRDTVHLFRATTRDRPRPDGREVIEARFFALDALPAQTSAATRRRLAELDGGLRAAHW